MTTSIEMLIMISSWIIVILIVVYIVLEIIVSARVTNKRTITQPVIIQPQIIHEEKDEQGRLHCLDNYAVQYDNGNTEYWIHGVNFSPTMFKDIFVKKTYTSSQILNMTNAEQKGVVIKIVGFEYILNGLTDYQILDEEEVMSKVTGVPLLYQVIEFKIDKDTTARIVKVQDHTTSKTTCLGVPRIPQTRHCFGAISWTFGLDTWNYNPEVEI